MPVNSLAGSSFTVTIGATAYTGQVLSGSIDFSTNIVREFTLGPNEVVAATSVATSTQLEFLYDEETGMYEALYTAAAGLTGVTVAIVGGGGDWTGSDIKVSSLSASFAAQDLSRASVTLDGTLVFDAVA